MKFIPDGRPDKDRYVPVDNVEEAKYAHKFQSLTDLFQPKDLYTRNIIQEAVGSDVLTEHMERLNRLIEARGEYVYLVRRKLDGKHCSCYNAITKTVMRHHCLECYGTRVSGGYDLYSNTARTDNKIIVASPFAAEEIQWEEWGRDWKEEKEFWTLSWVPLSRSRDAQSYDFIIRFNEDGTELGRYYITDSKPSFSVGNRITYQKFSARLADPPSYEDDRNGKKILLNRGDLIYSIDINKLNKIQGGPPIYDANPLDKR